MPQCFSFFTAVKISPTLKQVPDKNELQVRFHYWDSWEDRNNDDDKIILGRFTELLLVHFSYFVDRIVIE